MSLQIGTFRADELEAVTCGHQRIYWKTWTGDFEALQHVLNLADAEGWSVYHIDTSCSTAVKVAFCRYGAVRS